MNSKYTISNKKIDFRHLNDIVNKVIVEQRRWWGFDVSQQGSTFSKPLSLSLLPFSSKRFMFTKSLKAWFKWVKFSLQNCKKVF